MTSTSIVRVATDVGGTFTDLVYFRTDSATGTQEVITEKADTTPPNFERGVLDFARNHGLLVVRGNDQAHLPLGTVHLPAPTGQRPAKRQEDGIAHGDKNYHDYRKPKYPLEPDLHFVLPAYSLFRAGLTRAIGEAIFG